MKNRLFPKTRSWFALGAPLELLSPLSIARIVLALLAIVWVGAGVSWRRQGVPLAAVIVPGLFLAAVWLGLLRIRTLSMRLSTVLAALAMLASAALVFLCRNVGVDLALGSLFVPVGVFTALFLRPRLVLGYQAFAGVLVGAALAPAIAPSRAFVAAALWTVLSATGTATVLLLNHSSLRRASSDVDTGLPNGRGIAERIDGREEWQHYVVASILLEGIADARDALGYGVGIELLRRAVEDLGQVLPAESVIGRVVADELVIVRRLAPRGAPASEADEIPPGVVGEAQRLAETAARAIGSGRYIADGVEVSLRAHVGLAIAPYDGDDVEQLIRCASLSAPRAASNGLAFVRWDGTTKALTGDDLALLAGLRLAPERNELSLVYQPQVAARSGRTVSVEALLRWTGAEYGAVPPDRFILLAERTGLIDRLTEWVVCEALDAQVRWRAAGRVLPVSINLSARSLTKPELATWILGELERRSLPCSALSVEVTETAAASDLAQAVELLRPLYARGVRISIDDFGIGYTSLAVLPQLPLNELKVDKHFVLNSTASSADAAIVATVRELTARLGLESVAEGVENKAIYDLVLSLGYDLLQGYYLARPLSEAQLDSYLLAEQASVTACRPAERRTAT